MSVWTDKRGRRHIGIMHRGRRVHRICPEGTTLEQARRFETSLRQELFRVIDLGETPQIPLSQAIQRYLDEEVAHQKAARITTLKAYSLGPLVVEKRVSEISAVAVRLVEMERGRSSPATINRKLSILRRVAKLCYSKWGWLREPLHEKITKLPGESARHVYLSIRQVSALVRALETTAGKDAVQIATYTGLRQSEIWSLARESYRGAALYLPDSKTGSPRSVPVIQKIARTVQRWVRMEARPHPRTVYADFEQARVKIGMPGLRFHDLRHTCASLLAAEGVDLGTIGAILGHASTQTTKRYAHLSMDAKRKALRKIG